jgi:uncharacterized protein YxjI
VNYPLSLSFKILAIAQQITVRDSLGDLLYYVKQKAFKLKEDVTVFADEGQTRPLYNIKADRIIDISARYTITDVNTGAVIGAVKKQGLRSLWKAHYDVFDPLGGEQPLFSIREANPWIKVADGLFGELPIIGLFSGYLFHPTYLLQRGEGNVVMSLKKQPAFFEGKFSLEKQGQLTPAEETLATVSMLMFLLLERARS